MKCDSVATITSRRKLVRNLPREGTKLREIYDLFMKNKGEIVQYARGHKGGRVIDSLIDTYGLDIIPAGTSQWRLIGEWFGKDYFSYQRGGEKL